MKKLIVLLLALAVTAGAFAQVTTKVSLSGSVYLENVGITTPDAKPTASLAPNGTGYDVLTLSAAQKEGKYGFTIQDRKLTDGNFGTNDRWFVWSKPFANLTVTLGQNMDNGNYAQWNNNGFINTFGVSDGFYGTGIQVDYDVMEGLAVGAFLPLSGATTEDTLKSVKVGASYAVGKVATIVGQVNLDMVGDDNIVNAGFDYTGVKNLDVYGWAESQLDAQVFGFGIGGQYKTDLFRVGSEFEMFDDDWDVSLNLRYYVLPTLFVQVRPDYFVTSALASNKYDYPDGRFRVRGYVNYSLGNGLAVEGMAGYDTASDTYVAASGALAKDKPVNGLIHYLRLTYSVSL